MAAARTDRDTQPPSWARPVGDPRDRLRHRATTAPRPLRILFEAQLGYELWLPSVKSRAAGAAAAARHHLGRVDVVTAGGAVHRRTRLALAPDIQLRMARRLLPVAAVLGVLGLASTNLRTGGDALVFERTAGGGRQVEALAPPGGATQNGPASAVPASAVPASAVPASAVPGTAVPGTAAPDTAGATAPAPPPGPPAAEAPAGPTIPAQRGALPVGKGMWIWLADQAEGGNPEAIVARAKAVGLTHLYVRTASLSQGFYAGPLLDRLLPAAHAASIRVYAWDFPYLDNVDGDVARAVQAITYLTPDGHRVDGYAADIELRSMGVNITPATARHFGAAMRRAVGPNYPLIVCVPRPSPALTRYPYADLVPAFDAIAPMVYWLHQSPVDQMAGAVRDLATYGKPILPVGQAYDARDEGGPPGVPPREQLIRFMQTGDRLGAAGVSWWSWQHATQEAWDAIKDAAEFRLPAGDPAAFTPGQVKAYQTLLTSLGFPSPADGAWSEATTASVQGYQAAARLPVTGVIDEATRSILFTPFAPPVQPQP